MSDEAEGADPGNPDKSGSGAPEGGSPKGGSESESEKFERRIKAALANQATQLRADFDRQLAAFRAGASSQQKEEEKPQRYTRQQLKQAVDAGQISQEQADDVWARQLEADVTERATAVATNAVSQKATKERVDRELADYKRLKPEIMDRGSELRGDIAEAYRRMVGRGLPETEATELAAIESVLGPLDKLENAAKARRAPESHQESGGGDGKQAGGGKTGKKLVDQLNAPSKDYYEKGIKAGRYKSWDDVEAELKYATPRTRQKLGLAA